MFLDVFFLWSRVCGRCNEEQIYVRFQARYRVLKGNLVLGREIWYEVPWKFSEQRPFHLSGIGTLHSMPVHSMPVTCHTRIR